VQVAKKSHELTVTFAPGVKFFANWSVLNQLLATCTWKTIVATWLTTKQCFSGVSWKEIVTVNQGFLITDQGKQKWHQLQITKEWW